MITMLEDIKKRLDDPDEETRRQAVLALIGIPKEDLPPLLLKALGDISWRVRKTAVEAIFDLIEPISIIPGLLDSLHSEDNAGLRNSSLEALTRMGKVAIPHLIKVTSEDKDFRKFIVDILGNIGGEEVVPTLIAATKDKDENVRLAACEGLGKVGSPQAVKALLDILEKGDLPLRFTALEALSLIGRPIPMEGVYKAASVRFLRRPAYDVMGKVGRTEAIPYLVKGLEETSPSSRESAMVALRGLALRLGEGMIEDSLKGLDTSTLENIILALENPDPEIKRGTIFTLRLAGRLEALPLLLKVAETEEFIGDVASAIIGFGERAVGPLIQAYYQEGEKIRGFICYLIGEIGDRRAEGFLLEALKDSYGHVRGQTARALARLGTTRAIHPIVQLLGDKYEDVKEAAMEALSILGGSYRVQVLDSILPLLSSESPSSREKAVSILGKLGWEEGKSLLRFSLKDSSPAVRRAAIYAVKGEADFIQDITLTLADEDPEVRVTAAKVLGDMRCRTPLLSALKDDNIWVRCAAIEGLGKIGDEGAIDVIKGFIVEDDGVLVMAGLEAIGRNPDRLNQGDLIPLIVKALSHPDREVVKTAVEVLGRVGRVKELLPLLNHKAWDVRLAVVSTLHKTGGQGVIEVLKSHLQMEEDEMVRRKIEGLVSGGSGQ